MKHPQFDVYWNRKNYRDKTTIPFRNNQKEFDDFVWWCEETCMEDFSKGNSAGLSNGALYIFERAIVYVGNLKEALQKEAKRKGIPFATYLRSLIIDEIHKQN